MSFTPRPPAHAFTEEDYRFIHEARQALRPLGVRLVIDTDQDAYPEAIAVLPRGDRADAAFIVWKARAGWRIEDQRGNLSETAIGGNWAPADALAWITEALRGEPEADAGPAWRLSQ